MSEDFDAEFERINSMSEDELNAELRAEGIDPDAAMERIGRVIDMAIAEARAKRDGRLIPVDKGVAH